MAGPVGWLPPREISWGGLASFFIHVRLSIVTRVRVGLLKGGHHGTHRKKACARRRMWHALGRHMSALSRWRAPPPVAILALVQLVAWGTLYYGIAFLAPAIGSDTGWSSAGIFGAYSTGLLAAALLAAPVGRLLTRHGGRKIMSAGSALAAAAFVLMATSDGIGLFYAAWLIAGAAMAMNLYEAAFSTLREQGEAGFRRAIGVVTLVGGFASTLFWPLTHALVAGLGWRSTALLYAGLNLAMGLALYRGLPVLSGVDGAPVAVKATLPAPRRVVLPLAFAFACAALATSAVSAHVATFLGQRDPVDGVAILAMALIGPMQVAGRLLEWRLAHRVKVCATGGLAFLGLALGLALLAWNAAEAWAVLAFAVLYGAANGVLTVVRGGAPAAWLPQADYAATLGTLSAPALAARALAPLAMVPILSAWGGTSTLGMLVMTVLAGLMTFALAAAQARILER